MDGLRRARSHVSAEISAERQKDSVAPCFFMKGLEEESYCNAIDEKIKRSRLIRSRFR
jgi:hypothetical protein